MMAGKWLGRFLASTVTLVVLMAHSAWGAETFSAATLVAACKEHQRHGRHADAAAEAPAGLCRTYLSGFLAGLDSKPIKTDPADSYTERALQTRAYSLTRRKHLIAGRDYCLPRSNRADAITAKISALDIDRHGFENAQQVMDYILANHFRCPG